jgi:hypothetical protein
VEILSALKRVRGVAGEMRRSREKRRGKRGEDSVTD